MGKCLNLCALLLGSALVFGCATQKNAPVTPEQASSERFWHNYETALKENDPATGQTLVKKAHSAIGTPYVLGGTSRAGFDCSGLVKWAYNSIGVELPRTAREQSTVGQKIKNVEDMRAGDIVAFRHPKRGYHTGIYVGDGKFVHSPRKRTRVRINSLDDPYFSKTLLGARRVNISASDKLVAQAESRLDEFLASRSMQTAAKTSVAANDVKSARKTSARTASKAGAGNKKAAAKAAKKTKSGKSVVKKNDKQAKTVAAKKGTHNKKNAISTSKNRVRTVAHHTSDKPVKSAKNTVAARKTQQKSVSMLQHKKKQAAKPGRHS